MLLLTTQEAAELLDILPESVGKLILKGKIPAFKRGPIWMIEFYDVLAYRDKRRLTGENYRAPTHKLCKGCGETLPIDAFNDAPSKSKEKTGHRLSIRSRCKKCTVKQNTAHRNSKREYYQQQRSEAHKRNWEHDRALAKKWRKDNPTRYLGHMRRYQAKKRGTTVETVDYEAIRLRDGDVCYLCNQHIDVGDKMHYDHVIPLSKGGTHTYDNIRITHQRCNLRKSAKLITSLED